MADYLHCRDDGTAVMMSTMTSTANDVSVLPYADGMMVVVRVVLADGSKRCTAVAVGGMTKGSFAKITDISMTGPGAKILSFEMASHFNKKSGRTLAVNPIQTRGVTVSGTNRTSDALWVSGIRDVPTVVPSGHVAFLVMKAEFYAAIESGEKRSEFRKDSKRYASMLLKKKPVAVRLQYGYTSVQMVWEVGKVVYEPGAGFEIVLGRRYS